MKYICTVSDEEKEEIFLFPDNITHVFMAEALDFIRTETVDGWRSVERKPISAGFVLKGKCFGDSVTLKLRSRRDVDTALMNK